jgi:hypothetical protein
MAQEKPPTGEPQKKAPLPFPKPPRLTEYYREGGSGKPMPRPAKFLRMDQES